MLVYQTYLRLRDKLFTLIVRRRFESLGERTVLQPPCRLHGQERISLGREVFVGLGSWLQTLDDLDRPGTIRIGDRVSFMGFCVVSAAASIDIEDDVLFARNVYISDHSHRFDDADVPIRAQGIDRVAPVSIGSGAWIGQNVVVLPGVTIGRNAVIGANSVVRTDVPAGAIAAGSPARVIRSTTEE